jgi:hypothetical protein
MGNKIIVYNLGCCMLVAPTLDCFPFLAPFSNYNISCKKNKKNENSVYSEPFEDLILYLGKV